MQFLHRRKKRQRRVEHTPRTILIKQIVIGVSLATMVLLLGTGIWYGTRIEALTIEEVMVMGGETIAHDSVRAAVNEELNGSYFKLVPHRFAWTYPEQSIREAITAEERIKDVRIERRSGTELAIRFTEYHPAALWCTDTTDTTCLFLDERGYAFASAPGLAGGSFLRYSDTGREPTLGAYAFDPTLAEQFREFTAAVATQHGFSVIHVQQTASDEVVYSLAGGGTLKVSLTLPLAATLSNLDTILSAPEFADLAPGNFQYIDLRYGDRVFVNEEMPSLAKEESTDATSATLMAAPADANRVVENPEPATEEVVTETENAAATSSDAAAAE